MTSTLPKTPEGWAARLTTLISIVKGNNYFPIKIEEIARDFSKGAFPKEPITKIEKAECQGFEGLLISIPNRNGEWGIIYNSSSNSRGRQNFSIAHEFGHYLLHRQRFPKGKQCTNRDVMDWSTEEAQIEGEANRFAANVLMPLDDFRRQIAKYKTNIDLEVFSRLAHRYEVSLTAAILQWLSHTNERAMIVVSKDGFIDWAWSSKPLLHTGIYYKPKQETIELPPTSLAAIKDLSIDNKSGIVHPVGIWLGDEVVKEMTIFANDYDNMAISLLKYPKIASGGFFYEEESIEDTVDHFAKREKRDEL